MQDSKFSCLVFVRVEQQRFGDANFSWGELILIGQFFAFGSPGVSRENIFINHDFQHLTLILNFYVFKNGNSFLKTISQLNSYRNANITTIF